MENKILFIQYPKCTTCQKAKKRLDDNGSEYDDRHIKENNPTYEELKDWYEKSNLPLKRFFNTSGLLYKSMGLKDKLPTMSEEEQLKLLATDGMLVKRPIIVSDNVIMTGFKEKEWEENLKQRLSFIISLLQKQPTENRLAGIFYFAKSTARASRMIFTFI